MKPILIFCIAALIGIQMTFAQAIITGKVTSARDGKPVPGATIIAKGTADITVLADANGNYSIKVPSDIKTLEAYAKDYITKSEAIGAGKVINFILAPQSAVIKSKKIVKSKSVKLEQPKVDSDKEKK